MTNTQHLHEVLGRAAGGAQRREHVAGRDVELLGERLAVDLAVGAERGLAAEVDRAPARRAHDGVRVADRRRELGRGDDLVAHRPLHAGLRPSLHAAWNSRWSLVCMSSACVSASISIALPRLMSSSRVSMTFVVE